MKKYFLFCVVFLFCPTVPATETRYVIHADVYVRNVEAELFLNGIPLKRRTSSDQNRISYPAQLYLIDGINHLELVVNPGATPSKSRIGRSTKTVKDGYAEVKLVKYPEGAYPGDNRGKVLLQGQWSASGKTETFPRLISVKTDLGKMFGSWKWQSAEKIVLNRETELELVNLIKTIRTNYRDGIAEPILNIAQYQLNEAERAYPHSGETADSMAKEFEDYLAEMKNEHYWTMDPFNPETLDLRLVADGRMVEAIGKDWLPVVRVKPDFAGNSFAFRMFLGKINGQWSILRY